MQLLWLVFIPGLLNIILLLIFIPLFGYRVAVITTLISYWTQMFIPFSSGIIRSKFRYG